MHETSEQVVLLLLAFSVFLESFCWSFTDTQQKFRAEIDGLCFSYSERKETKKNLKNACNTKVVKGIYIVIYTIKLI